MQEAVTHRAGSRSNTTALALASFVAEAGLSAYQRALYDLDRLAAAYSAHSSARDGALQRRWILAVTMTTYRAIGKYPVDADDAEKRKSLRQAIEEASIELAILGCSLDYIEGIHDEALAMAEYELEQTT